MANSYAAMGSASTVMSSVRGAASSDDVSQGPAQRDVLAAEQSMSARAVLRRLLPYLKPALPLLVGAFLASIATTLLQLLVPILIGQVIDEMVGVGQVAFAELLEPLRLLALTAAGAALTQWIAGWATTKLSYAMVRELRVDAYNKLATLPLSLIDVHPHGDLLARIAVDVDQVGDGILQGLTQLLTGVVAIVGTVVFMASLSVPVTLVVIVLTPLSMFTAWAIAHFSSESFAAQQALSGALSGYAEEIIANQHLILAFAHEDVCEQDFDALNEKLCGVGERAQFVSSLANPSTRLVNGIIYAVVAAIGCVSVITGAPSALTVGDVQSLLSYANKYMGPFNQISAVVTQVQAAFASARRVFALLDCAEERSDEAAATADGSTEAVAAGDEPAEAGSAAAPGAAGAGAVAPGAAVALGQVANATATGDIEFRAVSFAYDATHPLLKEISFHIRPGQKFALVGPTGCGKTTLINLLLRFYRPDAGQILLDGRDIQTIPRDELRAYFGMVLQDTWLFEGSVRDNIAYGHPQAALEDIERAARRAHADRFIRQLPDGYDTQLSEDGGSLSQGQRQLLCIARVMLAEPPILLLDEATSSIDTRTEREVADAFDRMMLGRTSLVVAHRLSTVRTADCILVMSEGGIAEAGTHDVLMARGGIYAKLYESQFAQ